MVTATREEKQPFVGQKASSDLKLQIMSDQTKDDFYPNNPFDEKFDKQFWDDVSTLNKSDEEKTWAMSLIECRLGRLRLRAKEAKKDDVMLHLMDIYDRFFHIAQSRNEVELMSGFVQQLSEFVNEVLEQDRKKGKKKPYYSRPLEINEEIEMTVLHLAAARNLSSVIEIVLEYYPKQCYQKCQCGAPKQQYAIELALKNFHDDAAALLISHMTPESVRQFFQYDEVARENKFCFDTFAVNPDMKKTVMKILDSLINPEFPYIPNNPDAKDKEPWSKIPNVRPQRYHIYYRILDGDSLGRAGNQEGFDYQSHSGLYNVANSPFSEDIIEHPAIRLLTQQKWDKYGFRYIRFYIAVYVFYLISMSLAFFLKVDNSNRSQYSSNRDYARALFEALTFLIACFYALSEIVEMIKEGKKYVSWGNLTDLLGIGLVLSLLPIKFSTADMSEKNPSELEWYVAAAAYFVNVLRLFKWFPVIRYVGVHVKLITRLLMYDIPQFLIVYSVVAAAFLGSVILALKATSDGFKNAEMGAWGAVLSEIRALTETNGFDDSYIGKFKVGVIVLLMMNMLCCILILANVLIAHLSNVYTDQHARADIQCDVDRAKLITKIENSWFKSMSPRLKYYEDAAYIRNVSEVTKMLEEWRANHPN